MGRGDDVVRRVLERHGETYAEQAGITMGGQAVPALPAAGPLGRALGADQRRRRGCPGPASCRRPASGRRSGCANLLDRRKGDIRRLHAEDDDVRQVERLLQDLSRLVAGSVRASLGDAVVRDVSGG